MFKKLCNANEIMSVLSVLIRGKLFTAGRMTVNVRLLLMIAKMENYLSGFKNSCSGGR